MPKLGPSVRQAWVVVELLERNAQDQIEEILTALTVRGSSWTAWNGKMRIGW